jgi:hypothetical protein
MPPRAMANLMWLGRVSPTMQDASEGSKILMGLGRLLMQQLVLGKGDPKNLQRGLTGNSMLHAQATAKKQDVLPPSTGDMEGSLLILCARSVADVHKAHQLQVDRSLYWAEVQQRKKVCPVFLQTRLDEESLAEMPEHGVPPQISSYAMHMSAAGWYNPTATGPATRAASFMPKPAADPEDGESDENASSESEAEAGAAPTATDDDLQVQETVIGMDGAESSELEKMVLLA